jgi:hypothetical protein
MNSIDLSVSFATPQNSAIYTALGVIIGAIIAGGVSLLRDWKKEENSKRKQKQMAYSRLIGKKATILQSFASYYGAFIRSEFLDCRSIIEALENRLEGEDAEDIEDRRAKSLELTEGIYAKRKSEDLQLEVAKYRERFWETIGQIMILFPNIPGINAKIDSIKESDANFGALERDILTISRDFNENIMDEARAFGRLSVADALSWALNKQNELQMTFDTIREQLENSIDDFEAKIDDLLDDLKTDLESPYRNGAEWYPGYNDNIYERAT